MLYVIVKPESKDPTKHQKPTKSHRTGSSQIKVSVWPPQPIKVDQVDSKIKDMG